MNPIYGLDSNGKIGRGVYVFAKGLASPGSFFTKPAGQVTIDAAKLNLMIQEERGQVERAYKEEFKKFQGTVDKLLKEATEDMQALHSENLRLKSDLVSVRNDRGSAWEGEKRDLVANVARLELKLREAEKAVASLTPELAQTKADLVRAQDTLETTGRIAQGIMGRAFGGVNAGLDKIKERWPKPSPFIQLILDDLEAAKSELKPPAP